MCEEKLELQRYICSIWERIEVLLHGFVTGIKGV